MAKKYYKVVCRSPDTDLRQSFMGTNSPWCVDYPLGEVVTGWGESRLWVWGSLEAAEHFRQGFCPHSGEIWEVKSAAKFFRDLPMLFLPPSPQGFDWIKVMKDRATNKVHLGGPEIDSQCYSVRSLTLYKEEKWA